MIQAARKKGLVFSRASTANPFDLRITQLTLRTFRTNADEACLVPTRKKFDDCVT